jgi:hypothetical protein
VLEDVAPAHLEWKKQATTILEAHQIDAWKEWAPEWLLPGSYQGVGAVVSGGAEGALDVSENVRSSMIMSDKRVYCCAQIAEINKTFDVAIAKVSRRLVSGGLSAADAFNESERLEAQKKKDISEVKDLVGWKSGEISAEEEEEENEKSQRRSRKSPEHPKRELGWRPPIGARVSLY